MPHALIIDDDINNLLVLKEILEYEKITCTTIQDATQVETELSRLDQIDVIFLDLEMPEVDGYQLFDMLHSYPKWQNVTVVACTVHISELHNAKNRGFHSFIGKPLNMQRFPEQLRKILAGVSVWDTR